VSNPEVEWLDRARKGDEDAFSSLVEAFKTPVYNLCYRMLGDTGEAEDAAQETFWRAHQSLGKYDPARPFNTWLLSIAAHYCIDQIRKRHMQSLPLDIISEETAPDPEAPNPEAEFRKNEEKEDIRKLLNHLSPPDRAAIVLRYWYDLSDEEIGKALSLTVPAVKSRLHRARRELATLWLADTTHNLAAERRHHESPAF